MSTKTYIPEHYAPLLNLYDTQKAIGLLKRSVRGHACAGALRLRRVSAPLFVAGLLRPQRRPERRGAPRLL